MSDSTTSTPRPETEHTGPKYYAPKNKNCPYCGQAFTSSSLGRHLDLYIKPRNAKPPDGIHDVDEIRKMRGGITRRQVRNSSSALNEESTPTTAAPTPQESARDDGSPVTLESPSLNLGPNDKIRTRFNELNWQATGVINNLPPRPSLNLVTERRREVSRHVQQKTEFEQRQKLSEEWENGKAAELALKELLQNVRYANMRISLFDFDFCSLNFPALCLYILKPHSTLCSSTPFTSNDTWTIQPPGQKQYETLQKLVRERVNTHRQRQQHQISANTPTAATPASPLATPPIFDPEPQKVGAHLADAWNHWKKSSEKQKQEAWQLELLRFSARTLESKKETEKKLEAAQREIAELRSQPWARMNMDATEYTNMAVKAYSAVPEISMSTVKVLSRHGVETATWDYNRLLEKWRGVVRENRSKANGMQAQRSLSTSSVPQLGPARRLNGRSTTNSSVQVSPTTGPGSMSASSTSLSKTSSIIPSISTTATSDSAMDDDIGNEFDGEGDDEDAEGDVDVDDMADLTQNTSQNHHQPHTLPSQGHNTQHQHQQQHQNQHQQQHQNHNAHQQIFWDTGTLSRRSSHHSLAPHHQPHMMSNQASPLSMMPMEGLEGHTDGYLSRSMGMNINSLGDTFQG